MTDPKKDKTSSDPCCPTGEPLPDWAIECLSRLFSALGDPTRLTILRSLAERDGDGQCVSDLAEGTGLSMSAVSHQLRLLKDRGLVSARRQGRTVNYMLTDEHVRTLIATGLEHAQEDCPNRPKD
jgi:DNA-binding transcriptional ArsR family regulator